MSVNRSPVALTTEEIEMIANIPDASRGLRGASAYHPALHSHLRPFPPQRQRPREEEKKRLKTHRNGSGSGSGNGNDVKDEDPTDEAARARKKADLDDFNQAVESGLITLHRGPSPNAANLQIEEILRTGRSGSENFNQTGRGLRWRSAPNKMVH